MTAKNSELPGLNPGTYVPPPGLSLVGVNSSFESDDEGPIEIATSASGNTEASNTAEGTDGSISGPSRLDRRWSLDVSIFA